VATEGPEASLAVLRNQARMISSALAWPHRHRINALELIPPDGTNGTDRRARA